MTDELDHPQLPDYDFDRVVGRGGMGTVFLYRHVISQRPEVVKLLSQDVLSKPGNRERFEREIRAAFRLQHPNIVAAYSTHRVGESLAFCMEYVEGEDLMRVVQQEGPLPPGVAAGFAVQALAGLQHAHERGMVHRDIKPGNLMRTRDGGRTVIKVLDFGLAKFGGEAGDTATSHLTHYGQVLGTPDFIAPEQIRNTAGADIRADLYSLGCTLFYLLTGRPPYSGDSLFDLFEQHIHREPPDLDRVRPGLPPGLAGVGARLMAKNPADRPQTPAEAADLLMPYAQPGTNSHPSLQVLIPTSSVGDSPTPSQPQRRVEGPIESSPAQFVSLDHTGRPPAGSGRLRQRPASPTEPNAGWLLPVGVGLFLLAAVAVLAFVLFNDTPTATPSRTPDTQTTPPSTPSSRRDAGASPTTEMKPKPPEKPNPEKKPKPDPISPKSDGFTELVSADRPPTGYAWKAGETDPRESPLTFVGGTNATAVLFDQPPAGDFELLADVTVSGAAGLMMRADRRLVGGVSGYLVGLGTGSVAEYQNGAVHRWGHPTGRRKLLSAGEPGRVKAEAQRLKLAVTARGQSLTVTVDDKPAGQATDATGYTSGLFGLALQPGARLTVHRLAIKPLQAAPGDDTPPADPDFRPLVSPDRLGGWQVQGEDQGWELIGRTLAGAAKSDTRGLVGNLLSETSYENFVLRFEYWLEPGSAVMVSVRVDPTDGRISHPRLLLADPAGILPRDPNPKNRDLTNGSLIGVDNETRSPARKVTSELVSGTWHAVELTLDKQTCRVEVDGRVVNEVIGLSARQANYVAGLKRGAGRVGLGVFSGSVRVRNLRVKEL